MKLTFNIFLVGFSGSGKSTVGSLLSQKLGCKFVDVDQLIVKKSGKKITEIFDTRGEKDFRKIESTVIRELITRKSRPGVIALGGGAFQNNVNRTLISKNGVSCWLKCSQSAIYNRLKKQTDRPKLMDRTLKLSAKALKEKISRLHAKREHNYAKADLKVITSNKTANRVALGIIAKLNRYYAAS
jgi:shikimate kinase